MSKGIEDILEKSENENAEQDVMELKNMPVTGILDVVFWGSLEIS